MRGLFRTLFLLALLAVAAYVFRGKLLFAVAHLVSEDSVSGGRADVLYLLAGDPEERAWKAAELYRAGLSDSVLLLESERSALENRILQSGYDLPDQTEIAKIILRDNGVPEGSVGVIRAGRPTSTYEEALKFATYAREKSLRSVILVTSSFHSGRAAWIFRKALAKDGVRVEMAAAPMKDFGETDWWTRESGFLAYFNEYLKWTFYLVRYGGI